MTQARETTHRALKRLLVNGPLIGVPARPGDQALLLHLAAARFEAQKAYRESEVNEMLKSWLQSFCAPFGIDHVTMRRLMVDSGLLSRDKAGSMYRINPKRTGDLDTDQAIEPAQVLAEIQSEREARKRRRAT